MRNFILTVLALSFFSFAEAQQNFAHQLRLVDSVRAFAQRELKLHITDSFYSSWETGKDSMYIFLYVSQKDSIKIPSELHQGLWFYNSEDSATLKNDELKKKNYETLVYRTAGMSNAMLNRKLLSYPDEAIAFILFHEATHIHVGDIPYEYNEAVADAVANYACALFAAKTKMLNKKAVLKQKKTFETAYAFLNRKMKEAETKSLDEKQKIFKQCTSRMKTIFKHGNQFQKDRMIYEVNNAYFLRVRSYSLHYFELKHQLENNLDIDKVIEKIPQEKPRN